MSCCSNYAQLENHGISKEQVSACKQALRNFALHPPKHGELCVKRTPQNGNEYDSMIKILNETSPKNSQLFTEIAVMLVEKHLGCLPPKSYKKIGNNLIPEYVYDAGNCGGGACGQGPNPVIAVTILNMLNLDLDVNKREIARIVDQLEVGIEKVQVRQLYPEYLDENPNPQLC
jgi:hypothetical protein